MKKYFLIGIFVIILILPFTYSFHGDVVPRSPDATKLLFDDFDIVHAYYARSAWVVEHIFPYDIRQEYPLAGVIYISLPRFLTSDILAFSNWLYVMNGCVLLVLAYLFSQVVVYAKKLPNVIGFLFLPSIVYFSFSRFDVLPAALVLGSLLLLLKNKFRLAFVVLAFAFLAKWYALLLLPLWMIYAFTKGHKNNQLVGSLGIFIGIIGFITIGTMFFSGIDALFPYLFHMQRGIEGGSLAHIFSQRIRMLLPFTYVVTGLGYVATILQMSPLVVSAALRSSLRSIMQTPQELIRLATSAIIIFVLAGKMYSPQWSLWWEPLALLGARSKKEYALIVLADALNYVQFPLLFTQFGNTSVWYDVVVAARSIVMLVLIAIFLQPLRRFFHRQTSTSFVNE